MKDIVSKHRASTKPLCTPAPQPTAQQGGAGSPPADRRRTTGDWADGDRFLEITYRDGRIRKREVTRSEVAVADPDVDFDWNRVRGLATTRTQEGRTIRYVGPIPGVGDDVGEPFFMMMLARPGELLDWLTLAECPDLLSFEDSRAEASALRRLRRAFHDNARDQHFFRSCAHPYRVGWNASRTYRIVTRLPKDSELRPQRNGG